ncbi:MAG: SUMF1/EgtB/PvdO family nonheme iron enzyme, partial [Gemmataceae bacterium]|nr:SUMF1/EgtB/PvdO family nonheme iron enzyme [Gemmataceae bacterium]
TATPLVKIVPKGLRSFDANDADFFLDLLPGPRDRDGLPESIRFWKTRIEPTDPENTFAVGLIYGPSGCGKSSLLRAGLLPRLAPHVRAVYLEATAEGTEARLLKGLHRQVPDLPAGLGLVEVVAALRQGRGIPAGDKVLVVLDQFEQWLHARQGQEDTELVQALRHCDGGRVQGLVLVRDDFWMAVTRFLSHLEVRLVQGENTTAVDLFGIPHARKVLAAFGRAYGALPESPAQPSKDQEAFLDQAIAGLVQEGQVIPVRLALFAEMVKKKSWTPRTLQELGGTEGVGVTFLEETFSSSAANPRHHLHQRAARSVLKALLPETGRDIKGHMRSYIELLEASGYGGRPRDFEDLLRILDSELRLITPTDPEGREAGEEATSQAQSGQKYYQLTHDYLVQSLRDWLTRKQKETWQGRAELRLAERAASWKAKREARHLPAWWEWANIRLFTRKKNWTPSQRQMMRTATRYHGARGLVLALVVLAATALGLEVQRQVVEDRNVQRATGLVARLRDAEVDQVPAIVAELAPYRAWADPELLALLEDPQRSAKERLHSRLALLPVDAGQVQLLYEAMLRPGTPPREVLVVRAALWPYRGQLVGPLWERLEDGREPAERRLRAACVLASYDPANPRWDRAAPLVADQLVTQNLIFLGGWSEALRQVQHKLLEPLGRVFREQDKPTESILAANLLADYAADQPEMLAELIKDADPKQYAVLWPRIQQHRERTIALMHQELAKTAATDATEEAKNVLGRRQAQAAVVLLQLGQDEAVWPLLRHSPDPRRRTYLIHSLSPLGIDPVRLIKRLEEETDVSSRRALIRALGEFRATQLPEEVRSPLVERLLRWYREDPDPGIHGAVDWLLRHGKEGKAARPLDWGQAKALEAIDQERTGRPPEGRGWYIDRHGHTMVLFPGPVELLTGSPDNEPGHIEDKPGESWGGEKQQRCRIDRSFALASKPVTVRQFLVFAKAHPEVRYGYLRWYSPDEEGPMINVQWYVAAQYCRWLSELEGIPEAEMCYPPIAVIEESKARLTPLKLPADYLSRKGYRLPTEAEWEYACRAGTQTSRYYGETEMLVGAYGWYLDNARGRAWPVGQKRPNDFGLFDMYGNVWQWCQESARPQELTLPVSGARAAGFMASPLGQGPFPAASALIAGSAQRFGPQGQLREDREDTTDVVHTDARRLRGGGFNVEPGGLRSANRIGILPMVGLYVIGFRPARTLSAD